jgi:hypothetical protein
MTLSEIRDYALVLRESFKKRKRQLAFRKISDPYALALVKKIEARKALLTKTNQNEQTYRLRSRELDASE